MGAALQSEVGWVITAKDLGQPKDVGPWLWARRGVSSEVEEGPHLQPSYLGLPSLANG